MCRIENCCFSESRLTVLKKIFSAGQDMRVLFRSFSTAMLQCSPYIRHNFCERFWSTIWYVTFRKLPMNTNHLRDSYLRFKLPKPINKQINGIYTKIRGPSGLSCAGCQRQNNFCFLFFLLLLYRVVAFVWMCTFCVQDSHHWILCHCARMRRPVGVDHFCCCCYCWRNVMRLNATSNIMQTNEKKSKVTENQFCRGKFTTNNCNSSNEWKTKEI